MKDWDQPWKKKEPGRRLSDKARALQEKSEQERTAMSQKATQLVKIIFHKKLWGLPNQFRGVALQFSQPLRMEEIRERMHSAFPELSVQWEEDHT
ncbi:MAG: hypothetical protein MUP17_09480 [candidate division Zixibacteria bacterium]|nr:hypothetical protein [candidate division Zixibacteria bacterium]